MLKLVLLGTLFCINTFSFAATLEAPPQCPDINLIKLEGVSNAFYIEPLLDHKKYFIYEQSKYNTPQNWLFGIVNINAETKSAAVLKASNLLETVSGEPKATLIPLTSPEKINVWICEYETEDGYLAQAATVSKFNHHHALPTLPALLEKLS
ncbi:MAG: DUF4949 domain-containing protein [Legionella sp.]|nr:DUF4949 domain-containing protein [Legionella sp.]